jgi:hypothetical protein
MSKEFVRKIILLATLAALTALGGCAATGPGAAAAEAGKPLLSAADAGSMISVEIRPVEPLDVGSAVAVLMADDAHAELP